MKNKFSNEFLKNFINFFVIVFFVLMLLDLYVPLKMFIFGKMLSYKEIISYLNPKDYLAAAFFSGMIKAIHLENKTSKKEPDINSQSSSN